jgi:succinate-semialdehyde dehydrogenase/glutarate-semialdehyde dehydrogenase
MLSKVSYMMNTFSTVNPFSQQVLETYTFQSEHEIDTMLNQGHLAFQQWRKTSVAQRQDFIKTVKNNLTTKREAFAKLISLEMGKPFSQALAEIDKCGLLCDYYVDKAPAFLQDRQEVYADKKVIHALAPTGIVFGIMPWNYPFWQVFRYAIPNLIAGNTILLKHAPSTSGCSIALHELFDSQKFPNIFQSLIIDIPQVEQVIAHDAVQGVCLTGSVKAGSAVGALAGKHLKKTVLELGSADALVILDEAILTKALDGAFQSRTFNAGQSCIAAKRIFIQEQNLNEAITYLEHKLKTLRLGNPLDDGTNLGPVAKFEFVQQLDAQVKQAIHHGARRITGAEAQGVFFTPGIIISEANNPMNQEEIFGPVLNLIPYKDENTLLSDINHTNFGLAASVWATDEAKAIAWAHGIEAGTVVINDYTKSDPRIPFGGIKNSGFGRELGELGLRSFLNEKAIIII